MLPPPIFFETATQCRSLPADHSWEWEALTALLAPHHAISLGQTWLVEPEADFRPAVARIGWTAEHFVLHATMADDDIFNDARKLNDYTWLTGDAFEIYLRRADRPAYGEFHVTPENQHLQLLFPHANAVPKGTLPDAYFIPEPSLIKSWTRVVPGRWEVLAAVPWSVLEGGPTPERFTWTYSLCRYDATHGRAKPVTSSCSPHTRMHFHNVNEWQTLDLKLPRPAKA